MGDTEQDWELEVRTVWETAEGLPEEEVVAAIDALADRCPDGDPAAFYKRASAATTPVGRRTPNPSTVEPCTPDLTRSADPRAAIQLVSTLRNLGRTDEAISLLTAEIEASLDDGLDDARAAFLALALHDAGHHGRALSTALVALAPHLPAYGRAVVQYAAEVCVSSPSSTGTVCRWSSLTARRLRHATHVESPPTREPTGATGGCRSAYGSRRAS